MGTLGSVPTVCCEANYEQLDKGIAGVSSKATRLSGTRKAAESKLEVKGTGKTHSSVGEGKVDGCSGLGVWVRVSKSIRSMWEQPCSQLEGFQCEHTCVVVFGCLAELHRACVSLLYSVQVVLF